VSSTQGAGFRPPARTSWHRAQIPWRRAHPARIGIDLLCYWGTRPPTLPGGQRHIAREWSCPDQREEYFGMWFFQSSSRFGGARKEGLERGGQPGAGDRLRAHPGSWALPFAARRVVAFIPSSAWRPPREALSENPMHARVPRPRGRSASRQSSCRRLCIAREWPPPAVRHAAAKVGRLTSVCRPTQLPICRNRVLQGDRRAPTLGDQRHGDLLRTAQGSGC